MQNYMFRSPRNALIFAGLVVVGAVFAVGGEEDPGEVISTSEELAAQREALNREMASEEEEVEEVIEDEEEDVFEEDDIEYAADDDLIDDATGFDPTPDAEAFEDDFDDSDAFDSDF